MWKKGDLEIFTIDEIVQDMNHLGHNNACISSSLGILRFNYVLIKKDEFYYYFWLEQEEEFIEDFRYTEAELLQKFEYQYYVVHDMFTLMYQ